MLKWVRKKIIIRKNITDIKVYDKNEQIILG